MKTDNVNSNAIRQSSNSSKHKKQSIHLAWGSGDGSSGSSHKVEKTFVKGEIKFDHQPIKDVKVVTGQTTYQPSIDYTVNGSTDVIKRTENSSIPVSDKVTVEYSESTPPELITSENCSMNLADVLQTKCYSAQVMKTVNL